MIYYLPVPIPSVSINFMHNKRSGGLGAMPVQVNDTDYLKRPASIFYIHYRIDTRRKCVSVRVPTGKSHEILSLFIHYSYAH